MRRVLLIQLRQLGDILLTTPCARALKCAIPGGEIDFLSHSMGRPVLEANPFLAEKWYYRENDSWAATFALIRALRRRRFTAVIDFMNNPRSAFLARATGAPCRIAAQSRRWLAYTDVIPMRRGAQYIVREKLSLVEYLLAMQPVPGRFATELRWDVRPIMPWSSSETLPLQGWLMTDVARDRGPNPLPLRIALSPTHRREIRRWLPDRWAAVADRLQAEWQARVIWVWGPGEESYVHDIRARCRHPSELAPRTNLNELAALLGNVDAFIGCSNGPSHIAVAAATPSLQLHGHTAAHVWSPGTAEHAALQSPEYGVTSAPTLGGITPDAVLAHLSALRPAIELRRLQRQTAGGMWPSLERKEISIQSNTIEQRGDMSDATGKEFQSKLDVRQQQFGNPDDRRSHI